MTEYTIERDPDFGFRVEIKASPTGDRTFAGFETETAALAWIAADRARETAAKGDH